MEAPVRIENRAQLIYLLTEAAELEHGIMCCYLFSAFSIKKDVSEGVTEEQLAIMKRWRRTIVQIATEEMTHMALVCNLLTAVGGNPHTRRPNLPSSPRAYPPTFKLQLVPFGRDSLEGFIFLERPEEEQVAAVGGSGPGATPKSLVFFSDIFSSERQYSTVGHLYRGIEDGFKYLTQKYGEQGLFIGPPGAQIAKSYFGLPGLNPVTDLASAVAAIQGIVEQGEGARGDNEDSHHGRFLAIGKEYDQLLQDDPDFEPGRPVVVNPYSIPPKDVADQSAIHMLGDQTSINISNVFDGCYELLMQILSRLLMHTEETESQLNVLSSISIDLMTDVIGPLGDALTALPAGDAHPGMTAGPSFRFSRDGAAAPHQVSAWALIAERLNEMAAYCGVLDIDGPAAPVMARVKSSLARYAKQLSEAS
ncbi:MAG: ferritin-like protein [Chloroflexi bacterium]|nr:ferritin-like protein [Chloroflexota bacterium]